MTSVPPLDCSLVILPRGYQLRRALPLDAIVGRMRWPALVLASTVALHAGTGWAQTDDTISAARRLFSEAVADEDARRYETALGDSSGASTR